MRYVRRVLIAGVLFGACSCAGSVTGGLGVNSSKPRPVTCQAGTDCDLKWKRAYTWVVERSGLKLKTKTDGMIKTVDPQGVTRTLVVTITKNPATPLGTYEIDFIGGCSSGLSCVPPVEETRTSFANFVSATN